MGDLAQPNPPNASLIFLAGNDNKSLGGGFSTPSPLLHSSNVGFIDFDPTLQLLTVGPDHGSSQFVQPCPGGRVTAQTENLLQPQRTGAVLLRRDPPDRSEPHRQWLARILENRAGG